MRQKGRALRASRRAAFAALLAFAAFAPVARAQMCTPDFCEVPIEEAGDVRVENVSAVAHGYMDAKAFAEFIRENAIGSSDRRAVEPSDDKEIGRLDGKAVLVRLALALLAGLLLNLSPCVLPLLPIQLAILGMGAANGKRKGAVRGTVYGLSMALAYGAVGFAVAASGAIVGSLQSTRPFNLAMAALFSLLGLAMLGVVNIDFAGRRKLITGYLSLAGVAAAGVAAALLAGACVAPAVLATMLYAAESYAAGNAAALALPFALGLGMALPWPFIGAGLDFLPKPGKWMRAVKWFFAAVAFAFAAHYASIAMRGFGRGDAHLSQQELDAATFDGAYAAAVATGHPVVIDFFASWCNSCTRMEKTTFRDENVAALLADCEFLRVRLEDPLDPAATAILARFGVKGFPAIVVIGTNDKGQTTKDYQDKRRGTRDK